MKKYLIFIYIFLLVALSSCQSRMLTLDEIVKSGKIIITTNAEFAPFEYKEGLKLKGIDMDIARLYAKYIGVKADIRHVDFDASLLSVSTNKSDMAIAAITKSPAREETLLFSDSYYTASQVLIARNKSSYTTLNSDLDILNELEKNKATIGCQRGTTSEYYIKGDADFGYPGIKNTTCVSFDNGALAVKALSNGQIDAVIIDQAPALRYAKAIDGVSVVDVVLTNEEYSIAVNKNNHTLVASINEFIKIMKEDGSFDAIIGKYYG